MRVVIPSKHFAEGCDAGRHRDRVCVVSAAVKYLMVRDQLHNPLVRTKSRQRKSAADRLRQADHIRHHAEVFRSAAPAQLRARLHFVEDQQRAMLIAERPQPLKESLLRKAHAHVHHDRFKDDGRNLIRILLEPPLHRFQVVERSNRHVRKASLRHTCPARHRFRILDIAKIVGRRMRLHAHQRRIMQAVIAAFELDDLVASGSRAGQSNGMHGGFGAAVAEAAHLDGIARADFFRQFPLHVVRHAVNRALVQARFHGLNHRRMRVARHQRAETQVMVNVFVAVEIANLAPRRLRHKQRIRIVGAIVAGHAQGQALQVLLMRFGGLRRAALVCLQLFLQCGVHRDLQ